MSTYIIEFIIQGLYEIISNEYYIGNSEYFKSSIFHQHQGSGLLG